MEEIPKFEDWLKKNEGKTVPAQIILDGYHYYLEDIVLKYKKEFNITSRKV